MVRLLLASLLSSCLIGCSPRPIEVPPPVLPRAEVQGPTVHLAYPVDARPAGERRDGGWYVAQVPVPQLQYGDAGLRPGPIDAVDRAARLGLAARGFRLLDERDVVPVVDPPHGDDSGAGPDSSFDTDADADTDANPPWTVRLHVLHHAGRRDVSDAQWVSTVTGGIAGTVGALLYPMFTEAHVVVRVEVRDPGGALRGVRDVSATRVERRTAIRSWSMWTLWRRSIPAEMFEAAFVAAHERLAEDIATVVADVVDGRRPSTGTRPTEPAYAALATRWLQLDSLEMPEDSDDPDDTPSRVRAKYPSERFSLGTGHDTAAGEVVGRISVPFDTFGYEVGITDGLQAQVQVTVLGLANAFGGGLRLRLADFGRTRLAVQGRLQGNVVLLPADGYLPTLAGLQASSALLVSHRPRNVTWFAQAGGFTIDVYREVEVFPELRRGRVFGLSGGPGLEFQVTETTLVLVMLRGSAQFQHGNPLALGPLGSFLLVPQLALGFR